MGLWISQRKETLIEKQTNKNPSFAVTTWRSEILVRLRLNSRVSVCAWVGARTPSDQGRWRRQPIVALSRRERERNLSSSSSTQILTQREREREIWKLKTENENSVGYWESFYFDWGRWKWKYPSLSRQIKKIKIKVGGVK